MAASAKPSSNGRIAPEWADMQGLVLSAYPHLDRAAYLLFTIHDPERVRVWLRKIFGKVTRALKRVPTKNHQRTREHATNLNIAFTHRGLQKLRPKLEHFSQEFEEGMNGGKPDPTTGETHRSRLLGDRAAGAPKEWLWGGPNNPQVDMLVMVFADMAGALRTAVAAATPPEEAATPVHSVDANPLSEMKEREHFGFKDGMSQPILEGSADAERFPESIHMTALGEVVLGHYSASGRALGKEDRHGRTMPLPSIAGQPFGLNGSYLVVRQLAQDVDAFWDWIAQTSGAKHKDDSHAQRLAAKLIGRWPDGTPLLPYANRDDNEFLFHEDPYGYGCPIGAHVRRANPRSEIDRTRLPLRLSNDHRILRRGRSYGPDKTGELGLMFICLNADIERQFEFVQQTWINSTSFRGLEDELDPLIGDQGGKPRTSFTIPSLPVPHCVRDLPRFVTVRGGQYFFLPGLRALGGLAYERRSRS